MKTTVYVYPRLLLLYLCAPMSVDIGIDCIKTVYHTHVLASMVAQIDHDERRKFATSRGIVIELSLRVNCNTWVTTLIVAISYTCIEWMT